MRRLIVSTLTSLDGYFEGPGQDLMALPFDGGFDDHNVALLERATTHLFGRRFFEGSESHWTAVAEDDSQPPTQRRIAALNAAIDKVVISDSLHLDASSPWAPTTKVVRVDDAPAEIEALKAADGGDIVMFGSATTWNPLLQRGLVDEVQVLVGPALLGGGTALYGGDARVPLRLIDAQTLPDSQLVLLRYDATKA